MAVREDLAMAVGKSCWLAATPGTKHMHT